jgi:hypothetical protein
VFDQGFDGVDRQAATGLGLMGDDRQAACPFAVAVSAPQPSAARGLGRKGRLR